MQYADIIQFINNNINFSNINIENVYKYNNLIHTFIKNTIAIIINSGDSYYIIKNSNNNKEIIYNHIKEF